MGSLQAELVFLMRIKESDGRPMGAMSGSSLGRGPEEAVGWSVQEWYVRVGLCLKTDWNK